VVALGLVLGQQVRGQLELLVLELLVRELGLVQLGQGPVLVGRLDPKRGQRVTQQ